MTSGSRAKGQWFGRQKWYFIAGVPLLCFALAPFPFGCGFIFSIRDNLRGHPERPHGSHPKDLVGFWIREKSISFDFVGQAFYLMPDGRFAGTGGMTVRRWHFDRNTLFIDAVSRCGNCYQGNVTTEHTTKFTGPDQLLITNQDASQKRGLMGMYRKVQITNALKSKFRQLEGSKNEEESFRASRALTAIEQFEFMSNVPR